jgi:WD40 repeat protein
MLDDLALDQDAMTREDEAVTFTDLDQQQSAHGVQVLSILLMGDKQSMLKRRWLWCLTNTICLLLLLVITLNLGNALPSLLAPALHALFLGHAGAPERGIQARRYDGIAVPVDAAWSPDSHFIVVLGYTSACTPRGCGSGLVNLYDMQVKRLKTQWHPDEAIGRAIKQESSLPPSSHGSSTSYAHIAWSPDGQHLALTFKVASGSSSLTGVGLMSREGRQMQILLQRSPPHRGSAEWDIQQGRPLLSPLMPLPAALAYHWSTNGLLVPQMRLSGRTLSPAAPVAPVGNPFGDASFTIWQQGIVLSVLPNDMPMSISLWHASFIAWSPDGRYLIDGIDLVGRLGPPEQPFLDQQSSNVLKPTVLLSVRDAALRQIIASQTATSWYPNGRVLPGYRVTDQPDTASVLAWHPDGRLLARYIPGKYIDFYLCSTGHYLASFLLPDAEMTSPAEMTLLRWSPDGKHLLFLSAGGYTLIGIREEVPVQRNLQWDPAESFTPFREPGL